MRSSVDDLDLAKKMNDFKKNRTNGGDDGLELFFGGRNNLKVTSPKNISDSENISTSYESQRDEASNRELTDFSLIDPIKGFDLQNFSKACLKLNKMKLIFSLSFK